MDSKSRTIWVGSSPRVRGKRSAHEYRYARERLIPACAGKTCSSGPRSARRAAHPRVCGENRRGAGSECVEWGSSPRVRGKPRLFGIPSTLMRLIPACAGKTRTRLRWRSRRTAHPRVCGENDAFDLCHWSGSGSSPRVRGKPVQRGTALENDRLIPACAGKTGVSPP